MRVTGRNTEMWIHKIKKRNGESKRERETERQRQKEGREEEKSDGKK